MANIYYYCDGGTKKNTTVNMTESGVLTRTYTTGEENTEIIEEYKDLTFTFSPTVVYDTSGEFTTLLRIKYNYDFRTSTNGITFDAWQSTSTRVLIPSNTTTKTVQVLISRTYCDTTYSGEW